MKTLSILARFFPACAPAAQPRPITREHLTPEQRRKIALAADAMAKARTIASQHPGINVQRDGNSFWVTHDDFVDWDDERDPQRNNHWCTDGHEVLEAVQAYVFYEKQKVVA